MDKFKYFTTNNIKADLIYVDASHDTKDVVDDLEHYSQLLTGPKILCGDDFAVTVETNMGIPPAVIAHAEKHKQKLYVNHHFWFMIGEEEGKGFEKTEFYNF